MAAIFRHGSNSIFAEVEFNAAAGNQLFRVPDLYAKDVPNCLAYLGLEYEDVINLVQQPWRMVCCSQDIIS